MLSPNSLPISGTNLKQSLSPGQLSGQTEPKKLMQLSSYEAIPQVISFEVQWSWYQKGNCFCGLLLKRGPGQKLETGCRRASGCCLVGWQGGPARRKECRGVPQKSGRNKKTGEPTQSPQVHDKYQKRCCKLGTRKNKVNHPRFTCPRT